MRNVSAAFGLVSARRLRPASGRRPVRGLLGWVLLAASLGAAQGCADSEPIRVGILHSFSGTMAISEASVAQAALSKPFNPDLLRARIDSSLQRVVLRRNEQRLLEQLDSYLLQLRDARRRSDELLKVILPSEKIEELKATNRIKPERRENVAVLFCDVVGFTAYCDKHEPEEVVAHLQELVEAFEQVVAHHNMEKIKTIGDAFMATAGLLKPVERPVLSGVRCGLEMIEVAARLPARWQIRVGIHAGPVLTGVVGRTKYLFDLWGDTVNTAARVEAYGIPDAVCVSGAAWQQITGVCRGESRGLMQVKGKGELEMFRVDGVIA